MMNVIETELAGAVIIEPDVFGDHRGLFIETWQRQRYGENAIDVDFVQDNLSRSGRNTIRGLHFQVEHTQGKLLQALRGEIFDVAVDLRRSSSTFGKWTGVRLSEENRRQFYVPTGFAHGFCVLSETADVFYKCTDYYHPELERCLRWNDPTVGIEWPIDVEPVLSERDQNGASIDDIETFA